MGKLLLVLASTIILDSESHEATSQPSDWVCLHIYEFGSYLTWNTCLRYRNNLLKLFRETNAVDCENHAEHTYTPRGQNAKWVADTYSNHWAWRGWWCHGAYEYMALCYARNAKRSVLGTHVHPSQVMERIALRNSEYFGFPFLFSCHQLLYFSYHSESANLSPRYQGTRPTQPFLDWLILRSWRWKRYISPKRLLNFNGLHGVISYKIELFITTAGRISNDI
jgi:hypothetical protein